METGLMQMTWQALVSSRFDLLMLAVGLALYAILRSSSIPKKEAKDFNSKVDDLVEVPEVVNSDQWADNASARLSRVLSSIGSCDIDEELSAFLDKYPEHAFTLCEVQPILDFCSTSLTDTSLADSLLERMKPTEEWYVLNAFIHFYLDNEESEKACNVFELNYATFFDMELDENLERRLLMAALQCGRQSLAEHLLQTSQSEIAKNITIIQQWWRRTSVKMGESRVAHMSDVLNRLSSMFNARYPFEEHSDGESTCFLGDDSDWEDDSNDSDWDDREQL